MAIDYTKLALTAQRLITDAGRTVTLVKPVKTLTDMVKPWNGSPAPDASTGDADDDEIRLQVPGVQVLPSAVRIFGLAALGDATEFRGLVTFSELIYIVFAGEEDLSTYTLVRDGGVDYQIEATQELKPGNKTLLGYIGVRR